MNQETNWLQHNDRHLAATLSWIRLRLERLASPAKNKSKSTTDSETVEQARQEMLKLEDNDPPPALNLLASHLGLTKFDQQVLALCSAMELDTRIAGLCANAQGDPNKAYPTFALAFAVIRRS